MNQAKTVVLIHGHGVDASIWNELYEQLATDFQLIKPDFSSLTNHNTIEAYAEDIYGMLQSAQIEKATLIGHSMGGYIALAFAERHPDSVSGLVLFHSTVFADDEERTAKRKTTIEQLQREGSAEFIAETIPKMVAESTDPALVERLKTAAASLSTDALVAGMRAIAGRPDRSHVIKNATFPVLIIAGKEDNLIPLEKSEPMAQLVNEKGTFVVLEGVGHSGMLEKPQESVALLREFLVKV